MRTVEGIKDNTEPKERPPKCHMPASLAHFLRYFSLRGGAAVCARKGLGFETPVGKYLDLFAGASS